MLQTLFHARSIAPSPAASKAKTGDRDLRLDFFRGIALLIIFVNHTPGNPLSELMPARFGFSDSAEIFVFCSGLACALAFAPHFDKSGWGQGALRTGWRMIELYRAHIAIFLAIAALMAFADIAFSQGLFYKDRLNLMPFFNDMGVNVIGLLTLTYVPNYFDILPMYIVLIGMIPLLMALERFGRAAIFAAIAAFWCLATLGYANLPAEPWSQRPWFFNPFAWSVVFFAGFGLMRGWIGAPSRNVYAFAAALSFILVCAVLKLTQALAFPADSAGRAALELLNDKTHAGLLRIGHFLALAYCVYYIVGAGAWLKDVAAARLISFAGRYSLPVFLTGMGASMLISMWFDAFGGGFISAIAGNALGFAMLFASAYAADWMKRREKAAAARKAAAKPAAKTAMPRGLTISFPALKRLSSG